MERIFTRLARRTAALADAADVLRAAIARDGDITGALIAFRKAHAAVERATLRAQGMDFPEGVKALERWLRVRLDLERVRLAEIDAFRWMCEHPDSFETWMPPGWDPGRDVLVLVGPDVEKPIAELQARGQKRIVVVDECAGQAPGPGDSATPPPFRYTVIGAPGEPPPRDGIVWCRSENEAKQAVASFDGALPAYGLTKNTGGSQALEDAVARSVQDAAECAQSSLNTVEAFGAIWARQGIANLPSLARWPPVHAIDRTPFRRRPMFIVGAGPSLTKNAHLLRQVKGKSVIVAVSHALKALEAAGVTPDIVMALDAEDLRYHFDGCNVEGLEAIFASSTLHPGIYALPARRFFTFAGSESMDPFLFGRLAPQPPVIITGGSVATSAVGLAAMWGCSPITLVGMDLAFTDGRYYAATSCDGDTTVQIGPAGNTFAMQDFSPGYASMDSVVAMQGKPRTEALLEAPGYYGGTVHTSQMFHVFRRWLEAMGRSGKGKVQLFNCTEGGARIEAWEHAPLAQVIAEHVPDVPLESGPAFDEALRITNVPARRKATAEKIGEAIPALEQAGAAARECLALLDGQQTPESAGLLKSAEGRLSEAMHRVPWVTTVNQINMRRSEEILDDAEDIEDAIEAARLAYSVSDEAERLLLPVLKASAEALQEWA